MLFRCVRCCCLCCYYYYWICSMFGDSKNMHKFSSSFVLIIGFCCFCLYFCFLWVERESVFYVWVKEFRYVDCVCMWVCKNSQNISKRSISHVSRGKEWLVYVVIIIVFVVVLCVLFLFSCFFPFFVFIIIVVVVSDFNFLKDIVGILIFNVCFL